MRYGIALYLFCASLIVVTVAVGIVVGVVHMGTNPQITRYEQRVTQLELTRAEHALVAARGRNGTMDGFQSFVEEFAVLYGRQIVVLDPAGTPVADSRAPPNDRALRGEWLQTELRASNDGVLFGTMYMNVSEGSVATLFREQLDTALLKLLWWGGGLSLLLAIVLALFIGRPITRGIVELSEAARRAGNGDLKTRISESYRGELGTLATAFNTMTRDLSRAAVLHRNMVADTAHEVRTPISNILGYVEAVRDGLVSPGDALDAIGEETMQLTHLANDLQELALADAGSLSLVLQPVTLHELVERIAIGAQARVHAAGMTLAIEIDAQATLIRVDAQRIAQVFNNLLSNAITYSTAGSPITIRATREEADGVHHATVTVSVHDRGCGIPPDQLENVFDRFDRVDSSRVRSTGGSGLGLTIARSIVDAHGGTLYAENRTGGGTSFVFTLPAPAEPGEPGETA